MRIITYGSEFLSRSTTGCDDLFVGCDEVPKPAQTTQPATVLEGKTMGTFWRVSAVGVDAKRAGELQAKIQLSWMPTISFSLPIKMILR